LFFQVNGKAYFPAHSLACPNFPFVILEGIVIIEAQIKHILMVKAAMSPTEHVHK